jgi:predicted nucleic acid-binding protein
LIVVDASFLVAWLLGEPQHAAEEKIWDILATDSALVPAHWPNEVANALRRAVRTKRLPPRDVEPTVSRLAVFDIRLAGAPEVENIAALAQDALRADLSVYDLQYVQLAQAHRLPLATIDAAMRTAARRMKLALLPEQP